MNDFILEEVEGFVWDEANVRKNWEKHGVSYLECEEVFFNEPLIVNPDHTHSKTENRFFVLGKTDLVRLLFVAFTVRDNKIRVISARDMNKKERRYFQ